MPKIPVYMNRVISFKEGNQVALLRSAIFFLIPFPVVATPSR